MYIYIYIYTHTHTCILPRAVRLGAIFCLGVTIYRVYVLCYNSFKFITFAWEAPRATIASLRSQSSALDGF